MTQPCTSIILQAAAQASRNLPSGKAVTKPRKCSIVPYVQGSFESTCGLYAIINATRLIGHPCDRMDHDYCGAFYRYLSRTARQLGFNRNSDEGMSRTQMKRLLAHFARFVARTSKARITAHQPFATRHQYPLDRVLHSMRPQLSDHRCCFIIEIDGMHSHWTVVRGITRSQLQLFDSDGLRVLNVNDMRMSYERTSQRSRHVLIARSIFRLTRECPDKRAG